MVKTAIFYFEIGSIKYLWYFLQANLNTLTTL